MKRKESNSTVPLVRYSELGEREVIGEATVEVKPGGHVFVVEGRIDVDIFSSMGRKITDNLGPFSIGNARPLALSTTMAGLVVLERDEVRSPDFNHIVKFNSTQDPTA